MWLTGRVGCLRFDPRLPSCSLYFHHISVWIGLKTRKVQQSKTTACPFTIYQWKPWQWMSKRALNVSHLQSSLLHMAHFDDNDEVIYVSYLSVCSCLQMLWYTMLCYLFFPTIILQSFCLLAFHYLTTIFMTYYIMRLSMTFCYKLYSLRAWFIGVSSLGVPLFWLSCILF